MGHDRCHGKPSCQKLQGGRCAADLVERSSHELPPRREYPVSRIRGSVASMALDVLPPVCLVGQGDSRRNRIGWATGQWIERLGVKPPQIKL